MKLAREGYDEPITIPKADAQVVEQAAHDAVKEGTLWLTSGPTTLLMEDIPPGVLTDAATLLAPPQPIPTTRIQPDQLPSAWSEGTTTALAIANALSSEVQKTLPWITVRNAIDAAILARLIEKTTDSGPWPCDISGVIQVKFVVPGKKTVITQPREQLPPGVHVATAYLKPNQIQDLADQIGEIGTTAVGHDLKVGADRTGWEDPGPKGSHHQDQWASARCVRGAKVRELTLPIASG